MLSSYWPQTLLFKNSHLGLFLFFFFFLKILSNIIWHLYNTKIYQTCHSIKLYFIKKNSFLILAEVDFYQIWLRRFPLSLDIFGEMYFLLISENEFFHKINVTELQVCMEFMHCVWLFVGLLELLMDGRIF